MRSAERPRVLLFSSIAILGCVADLGTKAWFFSWPDLYGGVPYWLWTGHVGIQLSWNEGALFGMGQGNVWLFATLGIAALLAIPSWLFVFGGAHDKWLTTALGCVMAGVLGNLYDRLGLADHLWPGRSIDIGQPIYAVRDWMLWQWNDQLRWPNFNVADALLVVGAIILFWQSFRSTDRPAASSPPQNSR